MKILLISILSLSVYSEGLLIVDYSERYKSNPKTHPNYPFDSSESFSYLIQTPDRPADQAIRDKILFLQGKMNYYRYHDVPPAAEDIQRMKDYLLEVRKEIPEIFAAEPAPSILEKAETDSINISKILAKFAAKLLLEPAHLDEFKNIFEGKKFYTGISFPHDSLPTTEQARSFGLARNSGSSCDPLFISCAPNNFCLEIPAGNPACADEDSACSGNGQCCSGRCEFGTCTANTRCNSCVPEGTPLPTTTAKCCEGLKATEYVDPEEGRPIRSCLNTSPVVDGESSYLFKEINKNSCAPILADLQDWYRFERNERVLLAFEYLFTTVSYQKYRYKNHLQSIKQAAQSFAQMRITSKRSYEQRMNQIILTFPQGLDQVENTDALGADYHDFLIQEQQALLEQETVRLRLYHGLQGLLDQSIQNIQRFNWNKKRWFKKNNCGQWSIPLLRGRHHKHCYSKSWIVNGANHKIASDLAAFLKGAAANPPSYLGEQDYPRQCQTDPVFPGNAGFHIGHKSRPGGLAHVRSKIQAGLQAYAQQPIGNGATHSLSLPDHKINLGKQDGQAPSEHLLALSDVVIRSLLSYGSAKTCNNLHTSRTKVKYLRVVKDALEEVLDYYQSASKFRQSDVIPCLEERRNVLKSQDCDPADPDCHQQGPTGHPTDNNPPPDRDDPSTTSTTLPDGPLQDDTRLAAPGGGGPGEGLFSTNGAFFLSSGASPTHAGLSKIRNGGGSGSNLGASNTGQAAFQKKKANGKNSGDSRIGKKTTTDGGGRNHQLKSDSRKMLTGRNTAGGYMPEGFEGPGKGKRDQESASKEQELLPESAGHNSGLAAGGIFKTRGGLENWQSRESEGDHQSAPQRISRKSGLAAAITREARSLLNRPEQADSLFQRVNKAYIRNAFPVLLIKKVRPAPPFNKTMKNKKYRWRRPSGRQR